MISFSADYIRVSLMLMTTTCFVFHLCSNTTTNANGGGHALLSDYVLYQIFRIWHYISWDCKIVPIILFSMCSANQISVIKVIFSPDNEIQF